MTYAIFNEDLPLFIREKQGEQEHINHDTVRKIHIGYLDRLRFLLLVCRQWSYYR